MARKKKRIIAKFALAPSRAAYLLAVEVNVFMLAKRLKQLEEKKPGEVKKLWEKFGGDYNKLQKAIEKGVKHEWKKLSGETEIGVVTAAAVTAAISAALPIITASIKLFQSFKTDKPGDEIGDKPGVEDITTTITNDPTGATTGVPVKEIDETKNYTKPLLIGGAILVAGYFLMKRKK